MRRIAGACGLGYIAGVGIENMDIASSPLLGSPVSDIRANYADQAFNVVASFAGALALLFYLVLVAGLFGLLRADEPRGEAWTVVGLIGGIGGPVIAASGLAANAILVANSGTGLSNDATQSAFDLYLLARIVSGGFVALFLLGFGIAALRSRAIPGSLAWLGCAIAVPMALAPLAAFTGDHTLQVAVAIAFGFQSLWIFLIGLWMTLADGISVATFLRRATFLVLVIAAGLVGIALLAVPAKTGVFFSWGLDPAPLAAFAGGVYVGSAAAYAMAIPRPWPQVRGMVVGAVVLSVSVFVVTLGHLDIFDFSRLQAWAWVVLFAGFSLLTIGILAFTPNEDEAVADVPLASWARAGFGTIAALLGALAVALWIDPTGLSGPSPFALPPLGGRFAGCWIALLATLAGWSALRNRVDEARLPALALLALPTGLLIAAVRTISDIAPAGVAAGYLAALALLAAAGAAFLTLGITRSPDSSPQ